MVIGETFAWAHLPKTGGDATARMFAIVDHLVVEADPSGSHRKHETFDGRQHRTGTDLIARRQRLLNIRRLPSWVMSSVNHQDQHYAVPVDRELVRRGMVRSRAPLGRAHRWLRPRGVAVAAYRLLGREETVSADTVLSRHLCGRIDHWLRQEHLAEDFVRVVGGFGTITSEQADRIARLGSVNANCYDRDLVLTLDVAEVEAMYRANPRWAEVERAVYGDTLAERGGP
ncbi:hypothetical protein BH24ACT3_BH24ACT3_05730 [soil metagenome]